MNLLINLRIIFNRLRYMYIAARDRENFVKYNNFLLNEQSQIISKNNFLLSDQKKIQDIYDRLASDCQKCTLDTEKALRGASLIYRRDDAASQDKFKNLAHLLKPYKVISYTKIRMGRKGDGGYVMLNDFINSSTAISCGIGGDVSWDLDIANLGIKVYQYDHTVSCTPNQHANFHFFKKMIANNDSEHSISINSILNNYASKNDRTILKMDIEGSEWDILDQLSTESLNRFSQIVIEFHDFEELYNLEWYARAMRVFEKLSSLFKVVHVHGANTGRLAVFSNLAFPTVIEITWANISLYEFEESNEIFPTELDAPTDENYADIFLGNFIFKN